MNPEANAYLDHMEELKRRLSMMDSILEWAGTHEPDLSHYELMALCFRKLLELIAFSSLIAHREKYTETYAKYSTHWNAKRLLRNLGSINADFYPQPIKLAERNPSEPIRFDYVRSGYLTQEEFLELYGHASAALHEPNPFGAALETTFGYSFLEWRNRIVKLMQLHVIKLLDVSQFWIVMLASAEHKKASLLAAVEIGNQQLRAAPYARVADVLTSGDYEA